MSDLPLRRCPGRIHAAIDEYAEARRTTAAEIARQVLSTATADLDIGGRLVVAGLPWLRGMLEEDGRADWRLTLPAGDHAAIATIADRGGRSIRHTALAVLAAWIDAVPEACALAALLASRLEQDRGRALAAVADRITTVELHRYANQETSE